MRVEEEFGLKPCPFCGKEAVLHAETVRRAENGMIPITILGVDVYETRMYTTVTVGCSDDACLGRAHDPNVISFWDITSAVNAWNTRADGVCAFADPIDLTDGCSLLKERMEELGVDA